MVRLANSCYQRVQSHGHSYLQFILMNDNENRKSNLVSVDRCNDQPGQGRLKGPLSVMYILLIL